MLRLWEHYNKRHTYDICLPVLHSFQVIYTPFIVSRLYLHVQIVYILDQVRALEKEMHKRIKQQGLEIVPQILVVTRLIPESQGTACNQPLEKINGTTNAQILRVPFRQQNGEVLQQWISRYVWVGVLSYCEFVMCHRLIWQCQIHKFMVHMTAC